MLDSLACSGDVVGAVIGSGGRQRFPAVSTCSVYCIFRAVGGGSLPFLPERDPGHGTTVESSTRDGADTVRQMRCVADT